MKYLSVLAVLLASSVSFAADATVLTFDSTRPANGNSGYIKGAYHEQGYSVSSSLCLDGNTCFLSAYKSTTSLDQNARGGELRNYAGYPAVITFAKDDGGAFSLNAITLADIYGNHSGTTDQTDTVSFTFNYADGTSSTANYSLTKAAGEWVTPNTLTFDQAPLTSFSFLPGSGTSGFLQFDNVNLTAAAAVPEPASWAMMIGGFGLVGGALRRRRTSVRFA